MPKSWHTKNFLPWALILLVGFALGCSTDSPTKPQQDPQPPGQVPATTWVVTVSANPTQLNAGSTEPSVITVTVRRADNAQPPPDGATVVVSTSLGDFNVIASGLQTGTLTLTGGAAQVLLFAGTATGSAVVRAQIEDSIGSASVLIGGTATFFLASVSPSTGGPEGGDTLVITGGGIREPLRVLIDGILAQVQSSTSSSIRVLTPAIQLTPGDSRRVGIAVTNELGTQNEVTDTLPQSFTYTSVSSQIGVFSMTPTSGPNEGGTQVTITGEGFQAPVQVLFGQGSATSFSGIEATVESVTPTRIVATTPAATGFGQDNRDSEVDVLVRNLANGQSAVLNPAFNYGVGVLITAISPSSGPDDGGTLVTMFGQGFDEPVTVTIEGPFSVGQQIISVTGTEIIFRTVPIQITTCEDFIGEVVEVNVETGASASGPDFKYEVDDTRPRIDSVAPTSVSAGGGTRVTVTGANFLPPLRVTLDALLLALSAVTPTAFTFSAPFVDQDSLNTETCDDNRDGTEGERFLPTLIERELVITLLDNGCSDSITIGFVYIPTNRSCRGDVVAPVASFSFLVAGTSVTFTETSTGGPTSFNWNFGDGSPIVTAQNPTYDYGAAAAGMTFTVTLTVSNAAGTSSASANVVLP